MKFYKFLSIILALIISASIFTMPAFAADSASQLENENGMYNLESKLLKLKVSEDGELILTNIETGAAACSRNSYTANDIYSLSSYKKLMESEVVIDYYNINDASVSNQNSLAYSADAEISIRKEKNQIIAKYNFSSLKISFEVRYSVTDEYLKVDINTKSVKEGKEYKLNKISVLPGFFSGNGDDEGYIFVPDGCGALIDFNNDSDVTYTAEVYGKDISLDERLEKSKTENIKMQV